MARNLAYRYRKAERKRLLARISHLQSILHRLVSLGHTDPELKAELDLHKQTIKETHEKPTN